MIKTLLFLVANLFTAQAFAFPTEHLIPGGLAVIKLKDSQSEVRFQNKNVFKFQNGNEHFALIGIALESNAQKYPVSVNGNIEHFSIAHFAYPEQHLSVQNKHVNPSQAQLKRINAEFKKMNSVYQSFSPATAFSGLSWPIEGRQSSGFGLKRFFNGQARNPHSGLDIAAPTGTPIKAPAFGKVVLTGDFYFNGNSVFIDHGQGLISMLCHLSRINVKEGDWVNTGDFIGLVGATGRATGPHLHWTLSLNNARINPTLLLAKGQK